MENFKKYDKILRYGHDEIKDMFLCKDDVVSIERKIDGSNGRMLVNENNSLIFGSRTQQLTSNDGSDTNIPKNFIRGITYLREHFEKYDVSFFKNNILFFEYMIKHSLSYDWDKIPPILCFDIWSITEERYYTYDEKIRTFDEFDLPYVGCIYEGTIEDMPEINDSLIPICLYPPLTNAKQKEEGIVIKNDTNGMRCKFVRDEFKELNAQTFGGSPKYNKVDDTINSEIVFKFCTNARIEKNILALQDEGYTIEMALMKYLPKRVYSDIMIEEWQYIMYSKKKVDFGNLNKLITKRCLYVLTQCVENNNLINNG